MSILGMYGFTEDREKKNKEQRKATSDGATEGLSDGGTCFFELLIANSALRIVTSLFAPRPSALLCALRAFAVEKVDDFATM
jgi:hypothetical protein